MYRVIIIEDENVVRQGIILTTNWAKLGCVVVGEAANGEAGVELIRQLQPDLVVTDVKMPKKDGVEMIAMLRELGCESKFILLTAYSDFKYAQSALRLGVSDYLIKPLKDGDLENSIERIFKKKDTVATESVKENKLLDADLYKKVNNRYVKEAMEYIGRHYKEDLNITTVAEKLEISEGHLSRMFKKETDFTFTNYLVHYRIQIAMELLKDYQSKVYLVAEKVGYTDTNYFSVQFKKIVGLSPSEYQNQCKKEE